jgi:hypothetical protein
LRVSTSGATTFGGGIGDFVERLSSLTMQGGGATTLNGDVFTTGAQSYSGNVTLGANAVLTGTTPTFGANVIGNGKDLTLNFSGTTTVSGATFTGIRNFRTGGGGVTNVAGAFTTTGAQRYDDDVVLNGAATLTGTTPTFGGNVTGAGNDLTLNFSGTTLIDGAKFSGIRNLASGNGGTTNLTGAVTTSGTQTYDDSVTLAGNTTLTGTTGTFSGPIAGGGFNLALNFSGLTEIGGTSLTGVRNLSTGNGGITSLSGTITTTGTQTYNDNVTLGANTTLTGTTPTFGGTVTGGGNDLALNFSGTTNVDGATFTGIRNLSTGNGGATNLTGAITTTGAQTFNDNVALGGNVTLTGTDSTFGGTVTGAGNDLTLNFSGTTSIDGAAFTGIRVLTTGNGGTTSLTGALTTTGAQTYNDNVTLAGTTVLNSGASAVTFAGTVEAPLTPRSLTVTTSGLTTFGGAVGANGNALSSLTVDGGGTTALNGGSVTTTAAQIYSDNLTLGANTTLTGAAGTFAGVAGNGFDLALNYSGDTTLSNSLAGIRNLATGNGGRTLVAGTITTTGTQSYGDATVLTGDTTLNSGANAISFGSTVDGAFALSATGPTTFGGTVGATNALASIATTGAAAINGASMSTTGNQTYGGSVTLGADAVLNAGAGTITFSGTLESPATSRALTVTAANTRFGGAVGGNGNTLASLNATGNVRIDGGAVTTSGTQTYNNAVVIGANTALNSTAGGMTFGGALDADAAANNRTLLVNAPTGTVTFSGNVGANAAFADFDVISGPHTTVFNGSTPQTVNVTAGPGGNTVSFTGNVQLNQNLSVNTGGAANNNVVFNNGIDPGGGATNRTLGVNAGSGNVSFQSAGNATPLALLDVNGSTIAFNARASGQQIAVSASQVLVDPANGLLQALLPFSGFSGPAALTFTGTSANGGIFGTQSTPLNVDVPGLFVVTPNTSRALPAVWLTGAADRPPFYEFPFDVTRREVVYIGRPVFVFDPQQTRELLERTNEELLDQAADEGAQVTGTAREPERCTAVNAQGDAVLACAQAQRK